MTKVKNTLDNQLNFKTKSTKLLKKITLATAVASSLAIASAPVAAKKVRYDDNSAYDYAKVVDVQPVYDTYEVNNPVQHCYDERVRVEDRRHRRHDSKTPEIVGGIIGGVIGNQVGKRGGGKARDVATVVGAVLGGSIARDTKHRNRYERDRRYSNYDRYETVKRCETRDSYSTRKELIGYDVAYKYRGNVYNSHFAEHPGDRIKVKVSVDPL